MNTDYSEVAEQIFNLIDNDKDIRNDFFDAMAVQDQKTAIESWFNDNVNDNELQDLFKNGQNKEGFLNWICGQPGNLFFMKTVPEINDQNIKYLPTKQNMSDEQDRDICQEIESEDSSIMNYREHIRKSMSDGEYKSDEIDNDDEIQMAIDALDSSEDDDVNIVFNIIDGSEDDSSDEDFDDGSEDDGHKYDEEEDEDEDVQHKKRIYLDHHVNKVVEEIDKEEKIDR